MRPGGVYTDERRARRDGRTRRCVKSHRCRLAAVEAKDSRRVRQERHEAQVKEVEDRQPHVDPV